MVVRKSSRRKSVPASYTDSAKKQPKKKEEVKEEEEEEEETASSSEGEEESSSEEEEEEEDKKDVKVQKKGTKDEDSGSDDSGSDKEESGSEKEDDDEEDESESEEEDATGFTDDNAKWLKPKKKQDEKKKQLLSSDDEEDDDDELIGSDDDDEDSDDELLEVERQAALLDTEMEAEKEEAEEEMRRTISQQTSIYHLPTVEELEEADADRVVPPTELKSRIDDILEVLADFKSRREEGRSRSEYVAQLSSDMSELFGYLPELVEYFLSMFGPSETLEFLEASDKPRPLVVRVNTLKARRKDLASSLMKRGVSLDPLAPWSKVGLKIYESPVPIGATPEYLAGHYMLQSAASMCPVMALAPKPNERVLDMSSAPGGKTSYICQLMRNTGVVLANDLKAERQKATVANLHRLGVRNAVTCCKDGRKLAPSVKNSFDRVLLDAPCSGLGVISRDPSVKVQRTIGDVNRCAHLQKELLLAAIDALNHKKAKSGGGCMVYSTCSVAVAENEEVVNYALSKRDIKIVDAGLDFGKPGFTRYQHKRFHPSLALTRRFYPHVHNMDGFYVAKIQKLSNKIPGNDEKAKGEEEEMESNDAGDEDEVDAMEEETSKDDNDTKVEAKKNIDNKYVPPFPKGKKKKRPADDTDDKPTKKPKDKYKSVPPKQEQQVKKKKTNAKVTKPRRKKLNAEQT